MSDADFQPPAPTPEHERLADHAGAWKVACTYYWGPEPMQNEARETVEMLGPFWAVSLFEADMMGVPFRGRATTGFEPISGEWVSTWVDSMAPQLYVLRGGFDDDGQTLRLSGPGPHPMTRETATYRTEERWTSKDERHFSMWVVDGEGAETKLFDYAYTRA